MDWDHVAILDLFSYCEGTYDDGEQIWYIYQATTYNLELTVRVFCMYGIVGVSLRLKDNPQLLVDLALRPISRLYVRTEAGATGIYCHECTVLPGHYSFRQINRPPINWLMNKHPQNPMAIWISVTPDIGVRMLDNGGDSLRDILGFD